MLTTLLLALTLAAAPADTATALAADRIADAEADVATAAMLVLTCPSPAACAVARELAQAADDELSAARALAGPALVASEVDPFAPVVDGAQPFADDDDVPEAIEAQAAFELAGVQTTLDGLVQP